jgi:hypothetical protein
MVRNVPSSTARRRKLSQVGDGTDVSIVAVVLPAAVAVDGVAEMLVIFALLGLPAVVVVVTEAPSVEVVEELVVKVAGVLAVVFAWPLFGRGHATS